MTAKNLVRQAVGFQNPERIPLVFVNSDREKSDIIVAEIEDNFGGSVCFVCPVSYQTTSISGTKEEIFEVVEEYVRHLGSYHGGLIGYIEEYSVMGMSAGNYRACIEAFATLGRYGNS